MYKNKEFKSIQPLIFKKKLKDNWKIISLNTISSTLGIIRYFPPATQEWFNSIYAFNQNYIKGITILDKNLSKLIKSYFNLYFTNEFLFNKGIITRFKRLTLNKVFVSKAELKHTSNKVIITLYVYNEELRILFQKIKIVENILFSSLCKKNIMQEKNKILSLKDKLNLIKLQTENVSLINILERLKSLVSEKIKLEGNTLNTINKLRDRKEKELEINNLIKNLEKIINILYICENDTLSYKYYQNLYNKYISKIHLEKEIIIIAYYKLLLNLYRSRFEDKLIFKLKPLIYKIYNKDIEFNIVNIKSIYLNSDVFTQAISLKLKNRNNGLLKVLRSFLYLVKLSKLNTERDRLKYINIRESLLNKVKNLRINSFLFKNKDSLDLLFYSIFKHSNFLTNHRKVKTNSEFTINRDSNLLNYVLNNLKYYEIGGVRLEAKGRLTRRFTASRSVFKVNWKGSLKNVDSSYKGLSTTILKGHIKSNIQYSRINSKTRNGAFGIKGWISGK